MDRGGDTQYERLHRRLARRAVFVTGSSVVAALALAFTGPGSAAAVRPDLTPVSVLAPSPTGVCTSADLAKPRIHDMPIPEIVAATLLVHPAPDVEQLSPPLGRPSVSPAAAWSTAERDGFGDPSSAGSAQIMLGQLYAATPAIIVPHRGSQPVYSHTLVWAVYGAHQPEPGAAAGAPCGFESTMFYVDAVTGRALVGEMFAPTAPIFSA